MICNKKSIKGDALYLYGEPSSGKSLLTEIYFKDLYGIDNIGILNFSNSKYMIEDIVDKKIILINEYKHKKNFRELMLKLLDGSMLEYNVRYKSMEKVSISGYSSIISNYTIKEQGFDDALQKRFKSINLLGNFDDNGINFQDVINDFPRLTIIYILANFCDNNDDLFKHRCKFFNKPDYDITSNIKYYC